MKIQTIWRAHKLLSNCPVYIFCVMFLTFTNISHDLDIPVLFILGQICITMKNIFA